MEDTKTGKGEQVKNRYEIRGPVTAIFLVRKGEELECLIDTKDLPTVSSIEGTWTVLIPRRSGPYAQNQTGPRGRRKSITMHRMLLGYPAVEVDHQDGNGLNNRRGNIREAIGAGNKQNTALHSDSTSGYKGVSQKRNRWRSRIFHNGKEIYLGSYVDAQEAARAYDRAALVHFGDFARLNFPQEAQVAA
jgi:hypothetical protein